MKNKIILILISFYGCVSGLSGQNYVQDLKFGTISENCDSIIFSKIWSQDSIIYFKPFKKRFLVAPDNFVFKFEETQTIVCLDTSLQIMPSKWDNANCFLVGITIRDRSVSNRYALRYLSDDRMILECMPLDKRRTKAYGYDIFKLGSGKYIIFHSTGELKCGSYSP